MSKFPKLATLENDEAYRISRARLAVILSQTPAQLDAQPAQDIWDVTGVYIQDHNAQQGGSKKPGYIASKPHRRR